MKLIYMGVKGKRPICTVIIASCEVKTKSEFQGTSIDKFRNKTDRICSRWLRLLKAQGVMNLYY